MVGTATSQNATNELRAADIRIAANTTSLLADLKRGRIPPGSLISGAFAPDRASFAWPR